MVKAAFMALSDCLAPEFRAVLGRALALSLLLFIGLFAGLQFLFRILTFVPWPWLEALIEVGASLGLIAAFVFLMAPVTALFAGLFLDGVAEKVEARHFPPEQRGRALSTLPALRVGLQFGLVVLVVNILALPLVFTGVGAIVLFTLNAYLLSREYFEMIAMRHMSVEDAKALRKHHGFQVFMAGFLPALMAAVPVLNLAVPVFATSYFTHYFSAVRTS